MAVFASHGAVFHVAQFGGVRRARQHRGEDSHDHRQRGAFEAADGHEQAIDRCRGVGSWNAVAVQCPAHREFEPLLLVDSDLAVG